MREYQDGDHVTIRFRVYIDPDGDAYIKPVSHYLTNKDQINRSWVVPISEADIVLYEPKPIVVEVGQTWVNLKGSERTVLYVDNKSVLYELTTKDGTVIRDHLSLKSFKEINHKLKIS